MQGAPVFQAPPEYVQEQVHYQTAPVDPYPPPVPSYPAQYSYDAHFAEHDPYAYEAPAPRKSFIEVVEARFPNVLTSHVLTTYHDDDYKAWCNKGMSDLQHELTALGVDPALAAPLQNIARSVFDKGEERLTGKGKGTFGKQGKGFKGGGKYGKGSAVMPTVPGAFDEQAYVRKFANVLRGH
eukprot:TRINITY_DN8349_c0_g1_i1.p2 TRINITY_DN8349_c0_g1~~TRINITY_DN8349_c0_g1_i1.p2  ORF type:complete len:182 (+),score=46.18 TRINITY_DN8349_c0_g1_i1:136-681(+)